MVLFRADANEHIGTGHIMRCLSIAHAFSRKGEEVSFITADHRGDELIRGYDSVCLESKWDHLESELDGFKQRILETKPSIILVDSYSATDEYLHALREVSAVAYIDDLNSSRKDVDYLINYNIYATALDYSVYKGSDTHLLLGPEYTPLRDEFRLCKKHKIEKVEDILVSAGGADPEHVTETILQDVCSSYPDARFHFVVGAMNLRLDDIKRRVSESTNAVIHINEKNMSDLMMSCDIAISASGTTMYELCATGIPTIAYTLADNQIMATEEFSNRGVMLNAGDCRRDSDFSDRIIKCLSELMNNNDIRKAMSERMQTIVDGNGADRIVSELELSRKKGDKV